jgi:processive 1,2-diacylglycerol beta-glucosyltransferase
VNKLLSFRIKKLVNEFNPSVIVCTHLFPVQMLSNLKKKGKVSVPILAIITDYVVHPIWPHDCIDAYVLAHETLRAEALEKGFPDSIIHSLGIPISSRFLKKNERAIVLKELMLKDKFTILIMGGSLGYGKVSTVFQCLLNSSLDLQIIALTGHNSKLKKQLEKLSCCSDKSIKILSYTHRVADLMDISDLIVTKPGGLTVTESLAKKLPIVIVSPIPGQEERNATFLTNNGAAVRITEKDNMDIVLKNIIEDPLKMQEMRSNALVLAKPNSSRDIVELMHKLSNASSDTP